MFTRRIKPTLYACLIGVLFASLVCNANDDQPPAIGNFALPGSQQPGPLISFGQNMLAKNETQLYLYLNDSAAAKSYYNDATPSVLYGLTDAFSIFFSVPYAVSNKSGSASSSGLEDISVQFEYAYYSATSHTTSDQATIVLGGIAPTGSINKNPATGNGSPSFFLGTTFARSYVDWFLFASPGAELTTAHQGTKFGNSYLYQFGLGRNITVINGWILAWLIEMDGTYTQRNRFKGLLNPDSGGNVIQVTPSIWASNRYFIFQLGAGAPVEQSLNGHQPHNNWEIAANLGWSIY